jgi:sortase (surface protein transpeptidase)
MEAEAQRSAIRRSVAPRLEVFLPLLAIIAGAGAVALIFALAGLGPFEDDEPTDPGVGVTAATGDQSVENAAPDEPESPFGLPAIQALGGTPQGPPLGEASGMSIVIPKLGVSQPTVTMGILGDGRTFQVPNSAHEVAWYNFSGAPGSASQNAIFAGHINYYGATGTFRYIGNLAPGDIVEVHTIDGTVHVYQVVWARNIYKPSLTWEDVGCQPGLGCTSQNTITLITCGGAFDRSSGHYIDNTVVRAELVESRHNIS